MASSRSIVPRGGDGPDRERRVGERQQVGDEPEEPPSQGVTVVERTVREAGSDPYRLYGVGEGREREHAERGPAPPEVPEEGDEWRQGDEEGRDVGARARAGCVGEAEGEVGGREEEGGGQEKGSRGGAKNLREHGGMVSQPAPAALVRSGP